MNNISDRLQFLQYVANDNIVELICRYFDQNMACYNIIRYHLNDINYIYQTVDMENNVVFRITFNNNIQDILSIRDNDIIICYEKQYLTKLNKKENELELTFIEVV